LNYASHNNSLPAITVALARKKGFTVNEEQVKKELGFAVSTDKPYFESMRLGSTIGGAATMSKYATQRNGCLQITPLTPWGQVTIAFLRSGPENARDRFGFLRLPAVSAHVRRVRMRWL
jgi:hypothetical protein